VSNIFENPAKTMDSPAEQPVRTMMVQEETLHMAKLPGSVHLPQRNVEHVTRPRRGHDY